MNYKKITDTIKELCTKHMQVKTCFVGQTWDFQAGTQNLYPAVLVIPQPSTLAKGITNITINLFICDVELQDRSNLVNIQSDCLQIAQDLIAKLSDDYETYGFYADETNVNVEFFEEELDDFLAGVVATITFNYPWSGEICNIPIQ